MSGRISRRRRSPSTSRYAPGLILPLSLVFILLQPGSPLADPVGDPDESPEVGGVELAPEPFEPPIDFASLTTEICVFVGYTVFNEQDMNDTYGGMPQVGLEASVGTNDDVRFVIGLGYGAVSGDPFYDTADFEGSDDVSLRALPVSVGFRVNASDNPRFRLYWGAFVQATWMEEKVPSLDAATVPPKRTDRGWGKGLLFTLTPEWRSCDQRRAAGLTLMWGGSSGEVGVGRDDHQVNLIGMGARLHYTLAI